MKTFRFTQSALNTLVLWSLLVAANSLGFGTPIVRGTNPPTTSYYSNLFFLVWSNALPGAYALTAKATDNSNAFTVSFPVNITILPPSPPLTNPPAHGNHLGD